MDSFSIAWNALMAFAHHLAAFELMILCAALMARGVGTFG